MAYDWAIIPGTHNRKVAEVFEEQNVAPLIDDFEQIMEQNEIAQDVMNEKDRGRPGHYWGRSAVLEGAMPVAVFMAAAAEFDGDPDWWKDDAKFQAYMKRHPRYNWLAKR